MALLDGEVPADLIGRMVAEIHNESHTGSSEGAAAGEVEKVLKLQ